MPLCFLRLTNVSFQKKNHELIPHLTSGWWPDMSEDKTMQLRFRLFVYHLLLCSLVAAFSSPLPDRNCPSVCCAISGAKSASCTNLTLAELNWVRGKLFVNVSSTKLTPNYYRMQWMNSQSKHTHTLDNQKINAIFTNQCLFVVFSCPEQLNRWPCPLVRPLVGHH